MTISPEQRKKLRERFERAIIGGFRASISRQEVIALLDLLDKKDRALEPFVKAPFPDQHKIDGPDLWVHASISFNKDFYHRLEVEDFHRARAAYRGE